MLSLLLVFVVLSVVLSVVIVVLVKGNASLKAQHRAYVADTTAANIALKQETECFRLHAEAFELESLQKDEELQELKEKVATLEKFAAEKEQELAEATANEAVLKLQLDNVLSNYKKLEAYSVSSAKKSNNKKFDDCLFEDDYVMEIE